MAVRMLLAVCEFALAIAGAIILLQCRAGLGLTRLPQFLISVGWHGGGKK